MMCHLVVAVSLTVLVPAITPDASVQEEMGVAWAKKWAEKDKEFSARSEQATLAVLKKFDDAINAVNRQRGLTPAARTDRRKDLEAARKTFEKNKRFPSDDDFLSIELDYFQRLNKAALPLSQLIDEVIEKGSRTKNGPLENQGLKMRAELDRELGGTNRLVGNSIWHGQLHRQNGNTIPYHLHIGKMRQGGMFDGHVEDNPGVAGNWSYDVRGQTRGLGVQYQLTKSLRGNFTAVSVDGIVSGNRLIARIVQFTGKGKQSIALIVLRRVR